MADWKSHSTHEARGRRDHVRNGGESCQSRGRLLAGFFGGWGRLPGAGWHCHAERPVEVGTVRVRAIGERAERLIRNARAALIASSPAPADAALAEAQVAIRELTALAVELAERVSTAQGTAPAVPAAAPGAEVVERLKRLTGHERASVATALVRREQVPPAGAERRTLRVIPVEDRVVVQVRLPDDRRRGPDTYILHKEELLRLLPAEEASAVN
jgi:hypothetical protein